MKRSKIDLSHERKMSFNMGELVPMFLKEIVPGDSFRVNTEMLIRFAPLLAPMMHRVKVYTNWFFVPERLIWDESQKFHTGGKDGTDAPIRPFVKYPGLAGTDYFKQGDLPDYMGIPPMANVATAAEQINISALPFRAYQLIYNEFFRDQTLVPEVPFLKTSGEETFPNALFMQKRSWEKDYFTTCMPWAQRGEPVGVPVTDKWAGAGSKILSTATGLPVAAGALSADAGGNLDTAGSGAGYIEPSSTMSTLVNDIRKASRLQEFYEKMARGGARYIEYLREIWHTISSDKTLQRPQMLGGNVKPVVVSEVLSTYTNIADSIPQGNMTGHGISVGDADGFRGTFEEHGFVIGLISVMPVTSYTQGIERMWTRESRYDYYIPDFAHLGEQEVKNKEIYFDPAAVVTGGIDTTFGYQGRYNEYKFANSTVHGDFRTSMSYWEMSRKFAAQPLLNAPFIEADPTTRVFAVTDANIHHMYCQLYHRVDALRPMPYYSIPGL